MSNSTREGYDEYGKYVEERLANGWRKIKRINNGREFNLIGSKTKDYLAAIDSTEITLRLNVMSDRIELREGNRPITDFDESIILNRLKDYDLKGVDRMRDAIREKAYRNKYHPIREYLESLEWDGKSHFDALMNKLEMSSPMASVFWRKFLVGSVAKALGSEQNFMLVLLGAQGKGKSRLVNWLCPLQRYFYEGPINPDDKDCKIRLIENWLWEVAELDSTTRRSDRSALKYFITQRMVKVRVPYGRYDIEKPAAASMIGTINPDGTGFLNDPTGNRRFAVVHLDDIDWSYTKIDPHQLWAEIYNAYKNGEQYELTRAEQEVQNEINIEHTTASPLEELLIEHFVIDTSQPERYASVMDILEKLETLGLKGDQFRNKMELGVVMVKLGVAKKRKMTNGKRTHVYEGVWFRGEYAKKIDL